MADDFTVFRLEDEDWNLNLELLHDRTCNLRKVICEADLRACAARALRRARAAEIVAAWQAGELTEEQASRLLGWPEDPVRSRELLQKIVKDCKSRWASRLPKILTTHGE